MMHPEFSSIIITCEHAGNDVPKEYQSLFDGADQILQSHCGWDPGAIEIARLLASKRNSPLFHCDVTRLLIEANRSIDNTELFSAYSKSLPDDIKEKIRQQYYFPYRNSVESFIQSLLKPVLHLSIHTFTPQLNNVERRTDIGLLFDPLRKLESECSAHLREKLLPTLPSFQIDFNKPYAGIDDGFTTYLRAKFVDEDYAGIEIEINQKYFSEDNQEKISASLNEALKKLLD
ncbi:MAG: N-formylglutamate amidohydrolase [Chryseolinea sp.]